jgi:hypothetical protein
MLDHNALIIIKIYFFNLHYYDHFKRATTCTKHEEVAANEQFCNVV